MSLDENQFKVPNSALVLVPQAVTCMIIKGPNTRGSILANPSANNDDSLRNSSREGICAT